MSREVPLNSWIIGYIAGGAVVLVVALVLIVMIMSAHHAAVRAESILKALVNARDHTNALWALQHTKATAGRIVAAAASARQGLAGERSEP